MLHIFRVAASMPMHLVVRRAARLVARRLGSAFAVLAGHVQSTYPPAAAAALNRHFAKLDPHLLEAAAAWLRQRAAEAQDARFDLLGSGLVQVVRGETYGGFMGHRYGPAATRGTDWRADIVAEQVRGNRRRAAGILALIDDPAYRPVDWQVDFRSGYRWSTRVCGNAAAYGHKPGIDIKVPWELARLQHLPQMALSYTLDGTPALPRAFRNRVLDFMGANPPGWGVNWACAMDVAIRAVNLIVARDLFLAAGATFDAAFEAEFAATLLAHGRYIAANLEWTGEHRGNHYLADLVGLAFVAATLPASPEADLWLALAAQELPAEIGRQFLPDGANFEASTAYHRLSAELALWGAALLMGLPGQRRAALTGYDHAAWKGPPALAPAPLPWPPLSGEALARLAQAAVFAHHVTMPSGRMLQVGDNDSGRLLPLSPWSPLECGHLVAAASGLFPLALPTPASAAHEKALLALLARGWAGAPPAAPARNIAETAVETGSATRLRRIIVSPADPAALGDLETVAYPHFGLFLWRGRRAFIAVRCGPIGQNGQGGHAHNDQLAVEIEIGGVAFTRDPGTFVYTADLAARNRWRSAAAHFVPHDGTLEPARMISPFRLEDRARAKALRFDSTTFLGCHHGYSTVVFRQVTLAAGRLVVEDFWGGLGVGPRTLVDEHVVGEPAGLAALCPPTVPFSPGYGLAEGMDTPR